MSLPARRPWLWIALSTVVVALIGAGIYLSKNWPFTRAAITKTLEERFQRQVVIGSFRETWFPPGCVAGNVEFLHRQRKDLPPLFSARNFIVKGSWHGLLTRSISKIQLIGLRMTIPPPDPSGKSPVMPVTDPHSKASSVGEIEANDALLEFLPKEKTADKTIMQIHQLVLTHVNSTGPVSFHAAIRTDKPNGELTAAGTVGPWNKHEPAATSISGQYRYANADLKPFKGLGGLLSSQGDFSGVLSRINVAGSIDVPVFHVDNSAHNGHLTGQFRASVDSHTADVVIDQVQGHVGRTTILASGNVSGGKGTEGKTARIELVVNTGRVEDLLNYFSSEKKASMTGAVKLKAYVEVPPGPHFLRKIRLDGDFGVAGSKLTSITRQEPINHLSESARGEKKSQQEEDPRTVLSDLRGHVVIRSGIAELTHVGFTFPGASAAMAGHYDLLAKQVNLKGTLQTTGALSDTTSGFKAIILKVATPFFKKKHTTVFPFTITGPTSKPKIGLDWH